jgi:hypothetical protein
VPALQNLDFGLQDRDPGLRGGQASRRGGLSALGQGSLGTLQVADRETHRPEQAEQVGVQPRAVRARREGALQPAAGLLQQPARQTKTAQRPGQPRPALAAAGQRVFEGGAEVVLLGQQHSQFAFGLRQVQECLGVPPPGRLGFARRGQGLRSVLADGLQHPVPGAIPGQLGDQQRLANQLVHQIQRGRLVSAAAHRGRRGQGEPAGEHRQPGEHPPLLLGQQVITPADRGLQRLVPRAGPRPPPGQQPELIGQAGRDLLRRQHAHPRRGQLDRQRQAI